MPTPSIQFVYIELYQLNKILNWNVVSLSNMCEGVINLSNAFFNVVLLIMSIS